MNRGETPEGTCCGRPDAPCPGDETAVQPRALGRLEVPWCDGVVKTAIGDVPRARTRLTVQDHLSSIKNRWGVGRMNYRVPPGLYAVGEPSVTSPVLVSANYKMSFDHLRRALSGRDAWILVLDTRGINVWCAAGKGTFGTDEVVRHVRSSGLDRIVSHRKLVVPQLGATGVSAHLVRSQTEFRVVYGPVRASDLPAFLDAGMTARPEMRRVRFDLRDRAVLIPVEIVTGFRYVLLVSAALLLLSGLNRHGYSLSSVREIGLGSSLLVIAAFVCSAILGPTLLPWLPGRRFSVKGAALGLVLVASFAALGRSVSGPPVSWSHAAAWALIVPAIASFTVMNFTGATTFTSLSGVLREMRVAVPAQIVGGAVGLCLWVIGLFLRGGG